MKKLVLFGIPVLLALLAFGLFRFSAPPSTSSTLPAASISSPEAGSIIEGVHYRVIENSPPGVGDKIQVQEFFWYGCPHCQNFEPSVRQYKNTLPDDTELVQLPVTWNQSSGLHAAMHYVASQVNDFESMQDKLFETIIAVRQERDLEKHIEAVVPVFDAYGISETELRNGLSAADTQAKVSDAAKLMRTAGISGTPSMVVDNTWVVLNNEEVGQVGIFNVVNHLIEVARQQK